MIVLSSKYDKLDDIIAGAAMGTTSWSDALTAIAPLVGADGISMDLTFGENRMVHSLGATGFDQETVTAYTEHYHRIDPRVSFLRQQPVHGVIFTEELRRPSGPEGETEFWQWLSEANIPGHASAVIIPCVGDASITLAVHHETSTSDHRGTIEFFQRFYDKFNAINAMLRRKPGTCNPFDGPAYPLRNVDCFTFVVDDAMQVHDADDIIGYRLPLTGLARLEEMRLTDMLLDFQTALIGVLQSTHSPIEIERTFKTDMADTMIRVTPTLDIHQARQAHVTVTYITHTAGPEKLFMRAFGLTQRQAELLDVMRRVHKLEDAAEMMSISRNTARVFLGQIFDRTGVRNKSDLLRLAERFA